ncbi:MAG: hypothetical protein ACK4SX_03920 [Alcanivoracaceae bacterium]
MERNHLPGSGVLRQVEQRQCSECGHIYQEVHSDTADDEHWNRLPLCPACHRDHGLMHDHVMSLFRQ